MAGPSGLQNSKKQGKRRSRDETVTDDKAGGSGERRGEKEKEKRSSLASQDHLSIGGTGTGQGYSPSYDPQFSPGVTPNYSGNTPGHSGITPGKNRIFGQDDKDSSGLGSLSSDFFLSPKRQPLIFPQI